MDERAGRKTPALEVARHLAPAVTRLVSLFDVGPVAVAARKFGFEILPFVLMQLARGAIAENVDVRIRARHNFLRRASANDYSAAIAIRRQGEEALVGNL